MKFTFQGGGLCVAGIVGIYLFAFLCLLFGLSPFVAHADEPPVLTDVQVSSGLDYIGIRWDISNSNDVIDYEYSLDNGANWVEVSQAGMHIKAFFVHDLTVGSHHTVKLRVRYRSNHTDPIETVESEAVGVTIFGLKSFIGFNTVQIVWTQPPYLVDIDHYEYKINSNSWVSITDSDSNTVSHTFENTVFGSVHSYTIRAVLNDSSSYESNMVRATGSKIMNVESFLSGYTDRFFGTATTLSADETKLFIGEPASKTIIIFEKHGSVWRPAEKITPTSGLSDVSDNAGEYFGSAIAVNADYTTLAVGAPKDSTGGNRKGAVYLFSRGTTAWQRSEKIDTTDSGVTLSTNDKFGTAVALSSDGTTLFVGAPGAGTAETGAVYIFEKGAGTSWSFSERIDATFSGITLSNTAEFGASLAIASDGQTLAVGAPGESSRGNDRGTLYLFTKTSGNWVYDQKFDSATEHVTLTNNDRFGDAVAFSANGLVFAVGTPGDSVRGNNRGAVYVFSRQGDTWGAVRKIDSSYRRNHFSLSIGNNTRFGSSIALSDDSETLFIGIPADISIVPGAGAVYIVKQHVPPSFSHGIDDQEYPVNAAIESLVLPEAEGTDDTVLYTLMGLPDGLTFNPQTRTISGVPLTMSSATVTYLATVEDTSDWSVEMSFTITVGPSRSDALRVRVGYAAVELLWDATGVSGAASYEYKKNEDDPWVVITATDVVRRRHIVTGLEAHTAYAFSLRTKDSNSVVIEVFNTVSATTGFLENGVSGLSFPANETISTALALSTDSTVLYVGAHLNNTVHVLKKEGAVWAHDTTLTNATLSITNQSTNSFGSSLAPAPDSTALYIGARHHVENGSRVGAVYVLTKDSGGAWSRTDTILLDTTQGSQVEDSHFGSSVAISSDGATMYIGAVGIDGPNTLTNSGAVYIFKKQENAWIQSETITADSLGATFVENERFGQSLILGPQGNALFVGAPGGSSNGHESGVVYVLTKTDTGWTVQDRLGVTPAGQGSAHHNFGDALARSTDGALLFVSARNSAEHSGSTHLYILKNGSWEYHATPVSTTVGDIFGGPVAFDDTYLFTGLLRFSDSGTSGALAMYQPPIPSFFVEAIPTWVIGEGLGVISPALPTVRGPGTFTYAAASLPDGISFTANQRVLRGIPTTIGTTHVQYTATPSGSDLVIAAPMTITVRNRMPDAITDLSATVTEGEEGVLLSWTPPESPIEPIIVYEYIQDSESWIEIPESDAETANYFISSLVVGQTYTFHIRAKNRHGYAQLSNTAEVAFTDTLSPMLESQLFETSNTNDQYATVGDTLTLTFTVSEQLAATPTVTIAGAPVTVTAAATTYTAVYTVTTETPEGAVTYDIGSLSDGEGNSEDPILQETTVTVDRTAPVVRLNGDDRVLLAMDTPFVDPGASVDTGESVVIGGDAVFEHVRGEYTVTYSATDAAGNTGSASRLVSVFDFLLDLSAETYYDEARLTWSNPANTSAINGYRYTKNGDPWVVMSGADSATVSFTIDSLLPNTAYTFRVQALNATNIPIGDSHPITVVPNRIASGFTGLSLSNYDSFGSATALSNDGTLLAVGAYAEDHGGGDRSAVYIFQKTGGLWALVATLNAASSGITVDDYDLFGSSVAFSGDGTLLVVGASQEDTGSNDAGSVYVFTKTNASWTHGETIAHNTHGLPLPEGANFGSSVALSDDGMLLSAGASGTGAGGIARGVVHLFGKENTGWVYQTTVGAGIEGISLKDRDRFGSSVTLSADGTLMAVGADGDDTDGPSQGVVYLLSKQGSTWSHDLTLNGGMDTLSLEHGEFFGSAAAFSNDGALLAVGAKGTYNQHSLGAVYLFQRSGGVWTLARRIAHGVDGMPANSSNYFGSAVSLSDEGLFLVIGVQADDTGGTDRGSVYSIESPWSMHFSETVEDQVFIVNEAVLMDLPEPRFAEGAVSYTISAGTLPVGLELSGTTLQGTPTTPGSVTVTYMASDSSASTAQTATITFTINVVSFVMTVTSPDSEPAASKHVSATASPSVSAAWSSVLLSDGVSCGSATLFNATTAYTPGTNLVFNTESDNGKYVCFRAVYQQETYYAASDVLAGVGAPYVVSAHESSSNVSQTHVKSGDTISLFFTVSDLLQSTPSVTIGSGAATVIANIKSYIASYEITASDPEGSITYDIGPMTDNAGIMYDPPPGTFNLIVDNTAPYAVEKTFSTSNTHDGFAKAGDTLSLSLIMNETPQETPSVTIASTVAVVTGSDTAYTATVTVTDTMSQGRVSYSIGAMTDSAGNVSAEQTVETSVSIDTTVPSVTQLLFTTSNTDQNRAELQDVLTLTFASSEPLASIPTVTIAGESVAAVDNLLNYTAIYHVEEDTPPGAAIYNIGPLVDAAGNSFDPLSESSSIIIYTSAQETTVTGIISDNLNSDHATTGDTITVSFTVEHANFNDLTITAMLFDRAMTIVGTDGVYTAALTVEDGDENLNSNVSISLQNGSGTTKTVIENSDGYITVDTIDPVITLTTPNTDPAMEKEVIATVTETNKDTLVSVVTTTNVCDSTVTGFMDYTEGTSLTFTAETDNSTYVCFRATDQAGNSSYAASTAIEGIDTTAPVITLNGQSTITLPLNTPYTEEGATADTGETVTIIGTVESTTPDTYTITYRATDTAGNTGTATRSVTILADVDSPILSNPSEIGVTNDNTPDFTFTTTEAGTLTYAGGCSAGTTEAQTGDTTITFTALADAPYTTCTLTVTDSADNISEPLAVPDFTIDTTAPVITLNGQSTITLPLNTPYTEEGATADTGETVTIIGTVESTTPDTYTITYRATDTAGNTGTATRSVTILADVDSPILSNPSEIGVTNDNTPDFTFTTTEAGTLTYAGGCSAGTTEAQTGDTTITFTALADAPYTTCTLTVTDSADNISEPLAVPDFTIDTTAPVITLNGQSTITLPLNTPYTEEGATADTGETVTIIGTVESTTPDTYTITYRATDTAGNTGTATRSVTILADVDSPILSNPSEIGVTNDNTPDFTFTTTEAGTLTYAGGCSAGTTEAQTGDTTITFTALADAPYTTCTLTVTDSADNISEPLAVPDFTIDTTAPVITLNGQSTITLPLNTPYTEEGATADTGETVTIIGTVESTTPDTYTITYRATDTAGNTGTATRSVTILADVDSPILSNPSEIGVTNDNTPDFTFTTTEAGTLTYAGGCSAGTTEAQTGDTTITFTALADAPYTTCTLTVTDSADNISEPLAVPDFTIDTTAPVITLNGQSTITLPLNTPYTEEGATADTGETVTIIGTVESTTPDTYTITYRATDTAGNTGTATRSVTILADVDSPILSNPSEIGVTNDNTPDFTFTTTEAGTLTYAGGCSAGTTEAQTGDTTITFTALADAPYTTCTLTVTDSADNISEPLAVPDFTIDTTAPVITLNGQSTITLPLNTPYTEEGATADTGETVTIIGTVESTTPDTYTITYRATDTAGNTGTATRSVTILADVDSPILSNPSEIGVTNDNTPDFTFTTTEAGTLTYAGGCSAGTTEAQTGDTTITFTALADAPYTTCTLTVTDSADNISEPLAVPDFTIDTTAPVITLNGQSTITLPLNTPYTEEGATADTGETVTIIGTVESTTPDTYTITYRATDTAGNTGTATRSVTILADVDSPILSNPSEIGVTNDNTPDFTFTTTEAGTLTYAGGCSAGTTEAQTGDTTITFTALADAPYTTCTLTVTDSADSISEPLAVPDFTIDTTAPVITLNGQSTITLPLNTPYTEEGATADTGETVTIIGTVESTTPDTYTITYRATDTAGNTGTATRSVTILADVDSPILSNPSEIGVTNDNTPDFTFTTTEAGTLTYAGGCSAGTTEAQTGDTTITFTALADAPYTTCTLTVTDSADNISEPLAVPDFTIDTTAPVITLNGQSTITLPLNTPYTEEGATADTGETVTIIGTVESTTPDTYTITYRATDTAGNTGTATRSVTILADVDSPILSNPSEIGVTNDNTPDFTFTTTEAGTLTYAGGCSAGTTEAQTGDTTITFTALADAPYTTCTLTVTDSADNISEPLAVPDFTIDTTAPVITLNGDNPSTITVGDTYTDSGADADGGEVVIVDRSEIDTNTVGQYTVRYTAVDLAGNIGYAERTVMVEERSEEPVDSDISDPKIIGVTNDSTPEFTFYANKAGTIILTGGCSSATVDVVLGSATITFEVLADGTYQCTVGIDSGDGSTSQPVTIPTFTIDTVNPSIMITNASDEPALLKSISAFTTESNKHSFEYATNRTGTCDATIPDFTVYREESAVSFNAEEDNGTVVCFKAVDLAGNSAYGASDAIAGIDTTAPVVALHGSATIILSYDALYVELGAVADGGETIVITGGAVNTARPGTYTVTYSAEDEAGNIGTAQRSVTVNRSATRPFISSQTFETTNENPGYAKEDDVLTLTFITSVPLKSVPQVTIAGTPAIVTSSGTVHTAVHRVTTLDPQGVSTYDIGTLTDQNDVSINPGPVTTTMRIDTISPRLSDPSSIGTVTTTTPLFTFTASEAGTLSYGGNCSSENVTVSSPGSLTVTFIALARDTYTDCSVTLTDAAGTSSAPLSVPTFIVEDPATAPLLESVTITTSTGRDSVKSGDQITFALTSARTLKAVPSLMVQGEAVPMTGSGTAYSATYTVHGATTEGVLAYDLGTLTDSNDVSVDPAVVQTMIIVDRTTPVLTLFGKNPYTMKAGEVYVEYGVVADTGDLIMTHGNLDTKTPGTYTLAYTTTDAAGNSATITRSIVVEENVPAKINTVIIRSSTDYATLLWAIPEDGGSPILRYEYMQDDGQWTVIPGSDSTTTHYATDTLPQLVAHRFKVRAVNTIGPGEPSGEVQIFILGVIAPSIFERVMFNSNSSKMYAREGDMLTLTFSVSKELPAPPIVTMAGNRMPIIKMGGDSITYQSEYRVHEDTPEGFLVYTIGLPATAPDFSISTEFGTASVQEPPLITAQEVIESKIMVDKTAPVLERIVQQSAGRQSFSFTLEVIHNQHVNNELIPERLQPVLYGDCTDFTAEVVWVSTMPAAGVRETYHADLSVPVGTYTRCGVRVTDEAGNASNELTFDSFEVIRRSSSSSGRSRYVPSVPTVFDDSIFDDESTARSSGISEEIPTIPLVALAARRPMFTRNLTMGFIGEDAQHLQKFLNGMGYTLGQSGAGSPGQETDYFGTRTRAALAQYQQAYDISPAVGYFGPLTMAQIRDTQSEWFFVPGTAAPPSYRRDDRSEAIYTVQTLFNRTDCPVARSGPGSVGQETQYFGALTEQAIRCFEQLRGMPETGSVTSDLVAELREVLMPDQTVAPTS